MGMTTGLRKLQIAVIGSGAAVLSVALVICSVAAGQGPRGNRGHSQQGADTVLRDGYIYTIANGNPVAQALAIKNGEIVYVGTDAGVRHLIGSATDVIDLDGRMVMPGLEDGHIHDVTTPAQKTCDLGGKPLTVEEFRAMIEVCLTDPELHTAAPGAADDFLVVSNFYLQFLRPAGTPATKALFEGLTDRPIMTSLAVTGHGVLVNQTALDLAGITASTPDPEGGHIVHEANGEPNGLLTDRAADLVTSLVPPPPPLTQQQRVDLAAQRMKEFSKEGVTSLGWSPSLGSPSTQ